MKRLYLESRYNLFLCDGNQPKSPRSALQPARTCAQCFEAVDCSSRPSGRAARANHLCERVKRDRDVGRQLASRTERRAESVQ